MLSDLYCLQQTMPPPRKISTFPATVLQRHHVRYTNHDTLVDEVELIEANPQYVLVRHPDVRQATVSLRDLAPAGDVPDPKTTLEKRPDPSDTEIQPGDHRTAPDTLASDDTASVASPSDLSEESTSEALTTPDDPNERSMPRKCVHPKTDLDP